MTSCLQSPSHPESEILAPSTLLCPAPELLRPVPWLGSLERAEPQNPHHCLSLRGTLQTLLGLLLDPGGLEHVPGTLLMIPKKTHFHHGRPQGCRGTGLWEAPGEGVSYPQPCWACPSKNSAAWKPSHAHSNMNHDPSKFNIQAIQKSNPLRQDYQT